MQWLIDLVADAVMARWKGIIVQWHGAIVDIPTGWHLCDGTSGTVDLRDKFVVGAGTTYNPGATGGALTHLHTFTGAGHAHSISTGFDIQSGPGYNKATDMGYATGVTATKGHLPPYYALAFIQKI